MSYNRHILRRTLVLCLFLLLLTTLMGCMYSRWYYTPVEKSIDKEYWSIRFGFYDVGASKPVSEGYDNSDTAYYYVISLHESDTAKYPRLNFEVENVRLTRQELPDTVILEQPKVSYYSDKYVGATSVRHVLVYAPFRVPKQRPDTLTVDQDISVFYRDSGELLTCFHHVVKAVLRKEKYSRFIEILEGT